MNRKAEGGREEGGGVVPGGKYETREKSFGASVIRSRPNKSARKAALSEALAAVASRNTSIGRD